MTDPTPVPISMLSYALAYARHGWPIFPLHEALPGGRCTCVDACCSKPGKHPRTPHGCNVPMVDHDN
jgi:hypothetical protein